MAVTRAESLIADVKAAWRALPGAQATSEVAVLDHGKAVRQQTVDAYYRAPGRCELRVRKGDGAGASVAWDGGATAKVKKLGLGFEWPLTHPRLVDPHGWTLRDTAPGMVVRMLDAPGTTVTAAPAEGGLEAVEVRSPASPKGVTREVLAIDPARKLIVERRAYNGDELLFRSTVKAFAPAT